MLPLRRYVSFSFEKGKHKKFMTVIAQTEKKKQPNNFPWF